MIFSSINFLFYFLPVTFLLYFCVPQRIKNIVLLTASLFFYAWGEPRLILFLLGAILQSYVSGRLIERFHEDRRGRIILWLSVCMSLGLLVFCKYTDFFLTNVNWLTGSQIPLLNMALPVGISFYTFQMISYVVDVSRGTMPAQKNIIDFAVYASFFPQLIAGPIVRYADIAPQLKRREHTLDKAARGIRRFTIGLGKKVLLANTLSGLTLSFADTTENSILYLWLYAVAASLSIYFDFSGYSDMAIGLGSIMGFTLPENFNYPYLSGSITEFWRRWHMTLGSWFRDYVYIPMGGNRVPMGKWLVNILTVWLLTGFWHGAEWTFIVWGLYFAALLLAEKLWLKKPLARLPILGHGYVLFFVILSFVLFDAGSMGQAIQRIGGMLGMGHLPLTSAESLYQLKNYGWLLLIGIIGATPWLTYAGNALKKREWGITLIQWAEPLALLAVWLLVTGELVNGSFQPFLYFRF